MKNNELIISVKFDADDCELSFLCDKNIKLKALTEAIYYGLKNNDPTHFAIFEEYIKQHAELAVLYRAKEELKALSFKDDAEKKLCELGIVTTSCIIIPKTDMAKLVPLFPEYNLQSLLNSEGLEYNISTRRINVVEDSVIEILPPGEVPGEQKKSYFDVIIPTVISIGALALGRGLTSFFLKNSSGISMMAMMMATSLSTMVTQSYNFVKNKKDDKVSAEEWKINYENYLTKIWNRIMDWQKSDINYLCTTYPDIKELFDRTEKLNRAIFARSQNDSDFLRISLGKSENVKPMFEIKNEQKDEIFSDAGYIIHKDSDKKIEIVIPRRIPDIPEYTGHNIFKKMSCKAKKKSNDKARAKESMRPEPDGLLSELAYDLANKKFQYLNAEKTNILPPLMLDLKNCGVLGIIEDMNKSFLYSHHLINHMVFELAYYHTPEDLQFVFFFEREDDEQKQCERIKNFKNLPHTNELFEDASQFVFDKQSSAIVFGKLQSILGEREQEQQNEDNENASDEHYTRIVCIIFDDYDMKETGFSKYLPKPPVEGEEYVNTNGLTFIYVSDRLAFLPRYCGNIIEICKDQEKDAKLSSRYNIISRKTLNELSTEASGSDTAVSKTSTSDIEKLIDYKNFNNEYVFYGNEGGSQSFSANDTDTKYEKAFRQLSAIYYRRIAENGNVPSMVTLFELYNYDKQKMSDSDFRNDILKRWKESDVTKNLCVPMGKNEHGIVDLDLYEKADGPHMLVAGTTGSGKSETIITYLIGLCMKYSPTYLNLMLVDMKGGGFSDRLRDLPHCVGVVDDTAGESEGISAVYMLKRFLEVLNAEIKRRKLLLKKFGVDTVDAYIDAEKKITGLLREPNKEIEDSLNPAQKKQLEIFRKEGKNPTALSHLVLVVDEFTELKRFSSDSDDIDFISEITTIARVGRTLGFHIILVSQNIEGAITEDIRINSKSRICLKVATRAASKEMLDGRPDAASPTMPGNGRAYLLVGTGSKFLYFQSAYTGANVNKSAEDVVKVSQIKPCGIHNKDFYISTRHNERIKLASKNINKNDTQLRYIVDTIVGIKKENEAGSTGQHYTLPKIIFQPPLKNDYRDPTQWIMPEKNTDEQNGG